MMHRQRLAADFSLLTLALIWGSTFVLVKGALVEVGVFTFLALRFAIALLILSALYAGRLLSMSRATILAGGLIGLFLLGGFIFQSFGLVFTSASKAGFVTGLWVVFVPFLSAALIKRPPERQALWGVALATPGLFLLSLQQDLTLGQGDLLVLISTIFWALQVVALGRFSPEMDSLHLTWLQILVVAIFTIPLALFWERPSPDFGAEVWFAALFTGALATALGFLIQTRAQRFTSPTHTAVILAMEPVFAAAFGFLLAGDRLGAREILGCFLILAGMLVVELPILRRRKN